MPFFPVAQALTETVLDTVQVLGLYVYLTAPSQVQLRELWQIPARDWTSRIWAVLRISCLAITFARTGEVARGESHDKCIRVSAVLTHALQAICLNHVSSLFYQHRCLLNHSPDL